MASTLNTIFCSVSMARSADSPDLPRLWMAKPTSSAMNRVCSTLPSVSAESIDVGMIDWMKSSVPPDSWALSASSVPLPIAEGSRVRPSPGLSRLPTTSPIASATVDIPRK